MRTRLQEKRRYLFEQLERRDLLAATDFGTNPLQPLDVSRDGLVEPLDALLIINALQRERAAFDPALYPGAFVDVTGDGKGAPIDALEVINALARRHHHHRARCRHAR